MVLMTAGPPYCSAISMTLSIEVWSGTEPDSFTRPLTVSTLTDDPETA